MNPKKLRGMDTALCAAATPVGGLIRLGQTWRFSALWDMSVANHVGIITEDHGRYFVTEMTGKGITASSLDKYRTKRNRIIEVWRWTGFDSRRTRYAAQAHLARLREKRLKYGYFDLGLQIPWVRKHLPWWKDDDARDICSENWLRVHKAFGLTCHPGRWNDRDPSPHDIQTWLANTKVEWERVA